MPVTVSRGIKIDRVGAVSISAPFSSKERIPRTSAMTPISIAATRKNVESTSPMPDTKGAADIPAGAARPTPIIDKAKAGSA
ncbi:MAG: hypothetical protein A4E59_00924 [Syntrophorhabdus sp. PtaB.Bin027]|nr:MAG: hypothetical protein A4E59_00924 [Syntrophorhabdus sp. PtaB.Bin027]